MSVSIIAIDIAKSVFQVVGVDSYKHPVFEHRLRRGKLTRFMIQQPPSRVVMEACYTAHDWGRQFEAMGHRVELIPPQHVKPFVRGNKNDSNDALAIAEAADRPKIRYVPVKSPEQQAILGLHRVRQRLVKQRVQLMNQTRGLLAEFGQVFPLGHKAFRAAVFDCDEHSQLPQSMVLIVQQAGDEYRRISEQLDRLEVELMSYVNDNEDCQRLLTVPGVGPLTASALVASVGRGQAFAHPREFAVWLGLTPKHSASGDKSRTAGISKRGDRYLRTLFIHGARAALRWTSTRDDSFSVWANTLRERRGHHKAMVAVAHKMARISWALMHHQTSFDAH